MMQRLKRSGRMWGFFGFWGFYGFRYFVSHNINDLFYLSFFAFFGFYLTGKLSAEMPDERFRENAQKAVSNAAGVAALALFYWYEKH